MDIYNLIAQWTGWPIIVAVLLSVGIYSIWALKNRLEYQKEINEKLTKDINILHANNLQQPDNTVKYRAIIKLIHDSTGLCLHSHNRYYEHPLSSKQQQVTAFVGANDDDYWIVKGPHHFPELYKCAESIKHGDIIRLEHMATRKNLHSHIGASSPVTKQQEVTAYGQDGIGDVNDNWKVEIEFGGFWITGVKVRLLHQQTGAALHSHAGAYLPAWGFNQQEVTCYENRDRNDYWCAALYKEPNIV